MLKAIVVSDDNGICEHIGSLIDMDGLGLEIVEATSSENEALGLLEKGDIDILLSDIIFTDFCGAGFIKRAKEINEDLEIIVVSSYASFEYSQSAMRAGAGDYLTKPIDSQLLKNALEKAAKRCLKRREFGRELSELKKSREDNVHQLQIRLIKDMLTSSLGAVTEKSLWEKYAFRLTDSCYQFAMLVIDYDTETVLPSQLRRAEAKAGQLLKEELGPLCSTLVYDLSNGLGGVILGYKPTHKEAVRKKLKTVLAQLHSYSGLNSELEFSLAVSSVMTDVCQMDKAVENVRLLSMERLTQGSEKLLEKLALPSDWNLEEIIKPYVQAIFELKEARSSDGIAEAIRQLEQDVRSRYRVRSENVYELVRSASHMFLMQPNIVDGKEKHKEFEKKILHIGRIEKLFEALRTMIVAETETLLEQRSNMESRPIRVAKDYIKKHYSELITLETICKEIGLSSGYFSALFKSETGENFVKYLSHVRIERAKELLSQTNIPVSEVCTHVGYNDLKYFNQMFKKYSGMSPGQYRKMYG